MKILITGAAGFIGSHLCEKLHELGHEVVGIDNFNDYYNVALKKINASDLNAKGIYIHNIDLNDNLESVFDKNYDFIYHFAAQPGISATTPLTDYVKNNIFATQNLLEAIGQYNPNLKLFVNIATSSVYGLIANVNEEVTTKPISFYGSTKLAAEQLVLGQQRLGKLKACSIRLYSVYGPRERPEKLYTKLIENLVQNKAFPLFAGSAAHERSFTYVGDIIDGLTAIIGKEAFVDGEIINLGNDEVHTTQEGIDIVQEIMQKKLVIDHQPARKGDQEKTSAIIDKARKLIDYHPKVTFREGLKKQVEWYLEKFI